VYKSRRNKNDTVLATHQLQVEVKQENVLKGFDPFFYCWKCAACFGFVG